MIKKIFILPLMLLCCIAIGQPAEFKIPDSLSDKDYGYFIERLDSDNANSEAKMAYCLSYLAKAKNDKDWKEVVNAYKSLLHQSDKKFRLTYADSMVYAAGKSHDNALIGSAYLTKGIVYYDLKEHTRALDNYIIANNFISKSDDDYLAYKVRFNIAQIKYYLGFYEEAISLLQECLAYFEGREDKPYLSSLHSLGLCYNRTMKFDLCSATNELGVKQALKYGINEMIPYFLHSEGINQVFKRNYAAAITKLQMALPGLSKNSDFANEDVAYFYIGKSYWLLNQHEKALPFFKKVDEIFAKENYIRPDLRENYEFLIDYYQARKNQQMELFYINRLLRADSLLNANYKYLSGKIFKEYDTKKLLQAKEDIEKSMDKRNFIDIGFVVVIIILFIALAFSVYRHKQNKRLKKQKYKEFQNRQNNPPGLIDEKKVVPNGKLDINPDVVASVLKHLEKFEKHEKYRETDMTLAKLASIFDCNTKYISKIIVHYKNKKSTDYINDLKVDYIVALLKNNSIYKHYTIKALGEEVGFATTQHFTRAFSNRTGILPSDYIQELKKGQASGNPQKNTEAFDFFLLVVIQVKAEFVSVFGEVIYIDDGCLVKQDFRLVTAQAVRLDKKVSP